MNRFREMTDRFLDDLQKHRSDAVDHLWAAMQERQHRRAVNVLWLIFLAVLVFGLLILWKIW